MIPRKRIPRQFKILALDRHNVTKWMTVESNTHYGALCWLEFMAKGEGSTLIGDVELAA